jgi:hypothetical protein
MEMVREKEVPAMRSSSSRLTGIVVEPVIPEVLPPSSVFSFQGSSEIIPSLLHPARAMPASRRQKLIVFFMAFRF